jgi:hypothetical protein
MEGVADTTLSSVELISVEGLIGCLMGESSMNVPKK